MAEDCFDRLLNSFEEYVDARKTVAALRAGSRRFAAEDHLKWCKSELKDAFRLAIHHEIHSDGEEEC